MHGWNSRIWRVREFVTMRHERDAMMPTRRRIPFRIEALAYVHTRVVGRAQSPDQRVGLRSRPSRRGVAAVPTLVIASLVSLLMACNPSPADDEPSPVSVRPSRSTPTPTQSIVPAAVLSAAQRYSSLVERYNTLSSDLTHVKEAFRLLTPLRRAFRSWIELTRSAITRGELDISPHELDELGSAFDAWLENQDEQHSALMRCANGKELDEVTLIRCLPTIGPVVHRAKILTQRFEQARTDDPTLAALLEPIRF